ncbi:MAG: hypothetical protein LC793_24100, partial [Thermomicrobia bacterium]|nr:hypothetical protein [Thermomicrobia bacterium]
SITNQPAVISERSTTTATPNRGTVYVNSSGLLNAFYENDAAASGNSQLSGSVTGSLVLAGATYNGATVTGYKNGTAATGASVTSGTCTVNTPLIGGQVAGTATVTGLMTGDIYAVIVYSATLATADRQSVERYLNQTYSIY